SVSLMRKVYHRFSSGPTIGDAMTHVTAPLIYTYMRAWESNRESHNNLSRVTDDAHTGKNKPAQAPLPSPQVPLLTRPKFRRIPTVEELPRLFDNEFVAQLELPASADLMRFRAGLLNAAQHSAAAAAAPSRDKILALFSAAERHRYRETGRRV